MNFLKVTKHICSRNCFDSCGIQAYTDESGRLLKVAGDPDHPYTRGKICSKGYAYYDYIYHSRRLHYPMIQSPRFSGNWQRISWDDALQIVAQKTIDIQKNYGSLLPLAYLKGSGNYGILAEAMEGLFSSLGPFTKVGGSLCLAAGLDAQLLDFGGVKYRKVEEMAEAGLLLLWGVNPAATAIHQIETIQKVRHNGGKVILIDILPTTTSHLVDEFIQVKPGSDGALALAVLRKLVVSEGYDHEFVTNHAQGWDKFREWMLHTNPENLAKVCGVDQEIIDRLANDISRIKPASFWPGMGLQRYKNGGQNMRAINALAAASGNFNTKGGGIYYPNIDFFKRLNYRIFSETINLENQEIQFIRNNRLAGLNALGRDLAQLDDPPVKMLWVTCSNYLSRGPDPKTMRDLLCNLDLVVTVDHFMTDTARASDLVLPATTNMEAPDLVVGYWHNWMGVNQQAIEPLGECRSELDIACSLSKILNELSPGITSFPTDLTADMWLSHNIAAWLKNNYDDKSYQELYNEPFKLTGEPAMASASVQTFTNHKTDQKYRFLSQEAVKQGCPELPELITPIQPPTVYPFRFLCLRKPENLNSQFSNLEWISEDKHVEEAWLSQELAQANGISMGDEIIIYNEQGEIYLLAKIDPRLQDKIIISYSWQDLRGIAVNVLTGVQDTDMGVELTGFPGVAYHDTFVNIKSSRGGR